MFICSAGSGEELLKSSVKIPFSEFNIPIFDGALPPAPSAITDATDTNIVLVNWMKNMIKLNNSLRVADTIEWETVSKKSNNVFVVSDNTTATTVNTVIPIVLMENFNTRKYKQAITHIVDRFARIFVNQPERTFVIGVILSPENIAILTM